MRAAMSEDSPDALMARSDSGVRQMATLDTLYSSVRAGCSTTDVANEALAVIGPLKDEIFRSDHFGYSVGMQGVRCWFLSGIKKS